MKGIILLHYWQNMDAEVETAAMDAAYEFLEKENKDTAVLCCGVEIERLKKMVENFHNSTIVERDIIEKGNIALLMDWLDKNSVTDIKILGLHANACVAQLTTRLHEACELLDRRWETDFKVRIIKEATAALEQDKPVPVENGDIDKGFKCLLQ